MRREITRTKGARFCTLEVELEDRNGNGLELSICGQEGRIVRRGAAKKEALAYWESFFEESPEERLTMGERFGKNFRTAKSAARFVLSSDGEFHGLDVRGPTDNAFLQIVESCGQIRETLVEYFPEVAPFLKYHLNGLKAGCEHQEALGWGHGKTIALASADLTDAQREALESLAAPECEKLREVDARIRSAAIRSDRNKSVAYVKALRNGACSIVDLATLMSAQTYVPVPTIRKDFDALIAAEVARDIVPEPFDAAIYKDSLGAPCPVCGYRYGTRWLHRALPQEVVSWAEGLPGTLRKEEAKAG